MSNRCSASYARTRNSQNAAVSKCGVRHSTGGSLTKTRPGVDIPLVDVIDIRGRRHERVRLGGTSRLIVEQRDTMVSAMGVLVDLSEGGCQLHLRQSVEPYLAARVRLDIAGESLWLPVVTRWVRRDPVGWTVGCAFDGLTPQKSATIRTLLLALAPS